MTVGVQPSPPPRARGSARHRRHDDAAVVRARRAVPVRAGAARAVRAPLVAHERLREIVGAAGRRARGRSRGGRASAGLAAVDARKDASARLLRVADGSRSQVASAEAAPGAHLGSRVRRGRTPRRGVCRRATGVSTLAGGGARRLPSTRRAASWRSAGCSRRPSTAISRRSSRGSSIPPSARKSDVASYTRIAAALSQAPGEVRFISDVTRELAAARAAGLEVRLALRPGNPHQDDINQ